MKNTKISLILVYNNAQETIKSCLESIFNQTFKDFELICVNNACTDSSEEIVIENTKDKEFVKRMSLPSKVELEEAQNSALSMAQGDFICFLDSAKVLDEDCIAKLFTQVFSVKNNAHATVFNKMYKREFFENSDIIENIIESKIDNQATDLRAVVENYEKFIKTEFDKCEKENIENVSNKVYEVLCRVNQLEKTVWENDANAKDCLQTSLQEQKEFNSGQISNIYADISKVYEHINSQIDTKGCEIHKVYEEITKNYKYSEDIVKQAKEEVSNNLYYETNLLRERVENVEKDLILRYVNIKRLLDMQIDELDTKLQALNVQGDLNSAVESVEVSKVLDENIDKIYAHINKTNAQFYEELSNLYREMNEKLMDKMQEQQYSFDKKINELRAEFDKKIEALRGN